MMAFQSTDAIPLARARWAKLHAAALLIESALSKSVRADEREVLLDLLDACRKAAASLEILTTGGT